MENMFFISLRKYHDEKRKTCLLRLSQCKFSLLVSSLCQRLVLIVFLLSYRNTIFNQSACVFSFGLFSKKIIVTIIVFVTKFVIMIGSLHTYLSRNPSTIMWVSELMNAVSTSCTCN